MEINNKISKEARGNKKIPDEKYIHQISENWKFLLSEGCYIVRERAHAKWLFDLILSYQSSTILKDVKFQEWVVRKLGLSDVQIICKNADKEILIAQVMKVRKFPLNGLTILVRGNQASLKSEN